MSSFTFNFLDTTDDSVSHLLLTAFFSLPGYKKVCIKRKCDNMTNKYDIFVSTGYVVTILSAELFLCKM